MKFKFHSSTLLSRSSLLLTAAFSLGAGHAFAAGDAAATSMYVTIQPNAANTSYLYTMSWVAPDTDNSATAATTVYTNAATSNPYGNGTAAADAVTALLGGNYVNGSGQTVRYRTAAATTAGLHTQFENTLENTAAFTQWVDPANDTIGVQNPTTATPKFDEVGNFTPAGNLIFGSGYQGITGAFSTSPDGTGTATGSGVGVYTDDDGTGAVDSLGPLLSGFDDVQDPTKTNPFPNKGYVQVFVPYPTSGVTSDPFSERFFPGTYTNNAAVELVVTTNPNYVPKIAVSCDLDSDLDVDAADLTAASTGFGGAGVTGKWYATGDMNADGDNDNADLGAVIGAFTPTSASATIADLIYNPATGNVKLDASKSAGAKITSFQLQNGAGTFVPGSFSSPGGNFGSTYQDVTTNVIGDTDLGLTGFSGIADLGNVLPAGLDLAGLQAYLTTAVYTGASGTGQQQFGIVIDVGGGGDPTYASWSEGAPVNGDSNNDGVENGVAWALGAADVNENAIALLPTLDNTSDPDYVLFTFNRSDDAQADPSTSIGVEYGSDLENWFTAVADGDDVIIDVTDASPKDTVVVKLKRSTLGSGGEIFARLKVAVTP